ncbi:hypothetical protein TNCT_493881 [Trichonephila clavata]|uniref:Uncharacterized protein n=1 Tax=Trichonephila clavata TaxID=2740835 RepID=A0A8X6JH77_TRICU|nr:hypothetical protein TNCT_493881 [Trichonephila clavata]
MPYIMQIQSIVKACDRINFITTLALNHPDIWRNTAKVTLQSHTLIHFTPTNVLVKYQKSPDKYDLRKASRLVLKTSLNIIFFESYFSEYMTLSNLWLQHNFRDLSLLREGLVLLAVRFLLGNRIVKATGI